MTPLARVLNLVLLPTIVAPTWSARHAGFLEAQRRKISPPPPPPMNKWSAEVVAAVAGGAGLSADTFKEHDVDGVALHEMGNHYDKTGAMPEVVSKASDKSGPRLRFLRMLRKWASDADKPLPPLPAQPPSPFPPPHAPPPRRPPSSGLFIG